VPGIVAIPHLGASTEESEDNCAVMAAHELIDYIENGNITNSVNYPSVKLDASSCPRMVILHKNIPNMISGITGILSAQELNIDNMANRSKGEYAATIIDTDKAISNETVDKIASLDGIVRVNRIR
ncbi:MAG: 3-phosphoglycerate dehydrogenase, partial [Lachnospiraceae bacterium]